MKKVTPAAATTTPDWYLDARFGASIHWGLYSIPGRGEWVRSVERLTVEQYQPYFDSFRPEPDCVATWARLAKRAGARYVILTTKHHDGFCLWDSKLTDYKSTRTPAARDFVREYVDALRAEGLKVGLYYSLVDWHHRDYPAYGDRQHPLRHDPASRQRDKKANWSRYVTYLHGQVEELLTRYGKIDLLAFDFSYWDFEGEKWGATELLRKIRQWQPGILVNDRMGKEPLKERFRPAFAGDFDHVEQNIPREPVTDRNGKVIPWDVWFTLNNHWSFNPNDHDFKPVSAIVRALVNCVSKGGNLSLNFSPDARGRVSAEAVGILEGVGDWLGRNGESIYGCGAAEFPKPEWGRFTQRDRTLYAHLLEPVIGHITLPDLRGRVKNGRVLATGSEAILCDFWNPGVQTFDRPDDIFFNFGKPVAWTFPVPDPIDTVVRFDLTNEKERAARVRRYQKEFQQSLRRLPY